MDKSGNKPFFGRVLEEVRKSAGISQSELAKRAGFDHSYVSRLESGNRKATRDSVLSIAWVFGFTEGDSNFERLMNSAGYSTSLDPVRFHCSEIRYLNQIYWISSQETQKEIEVVLQLLIEAVDNRNRLSS